MSMEMKDVNYAGDIGAEIIAIDTLDEIMSIMETRASHTSECGTFLTIYCC